MEKSMNKNRDYCKFVEDIKKEVQDIIKDWGAEAVFVPAGSPETEDCLIVKIPTDEGMGMQRFLMEEIYQDLRDKGDDGRDCGRSQRCAEDGAPGVRNGGA